MPTSVDQVVSVYQDLADWHDRRGQVQLRDRFLVLAADTAFAAGRVQEAERLRLTLLQRNPHHLVKGFDSYGQAQSSPDVQSYLNDLRHNYPPEAAEQLLESLRGGAQGKDGGREPDLAETIPVKPGDLAAAAAEPLKVYRLQQDPAPAARPAPAPPAKPGPVLRPRNTPTRPPAAYPLRPEPATLRPPARGEAAPEPEGRLSAWFCTALAALVLAAGAALAVYSLVLPLFP